MMSPKYIFILMIALILIHQCLKNPNQPENNIPDSTSHNFVWEIDTLGIYGSVLSDVWIVNEDNIWVVGKIIMPDPDSSWNGTGRERFNAAHWDGGHWTFSRFERGAPLKSIWYFNENDIWASGGVPLHWDGEKWDYYHLWNMGILDNNDGGVDHIWASSPDNIYFVGRKGSIVHYNGSDFKKIDNDNDLSINDVWGFSKNNIYFCQYESFSDASSGILHYNGQNLSQIFYSEEINYDSDSLAGVAHTIWGYQDTLYVGVSSGIWKESIKTGQGIMIPWGNIFDEVIYSNKIRGLHYNDIFVVGNKMRFAHYNGASWRDFSNIFGRIGTYESVDITKDMVCAVGWTNNYQGIVVVGKR